MKKLLLIGVGFVLAVGIFAVAGFAYAQTQNPPDPPTSDDAEFPDGRAGWSRGAQGSRMGGMLPGQMMGFGLDGDEPGPLHEYLWPAVADAFGLTEEQIQAFEIVRETLQGIRADFTQEEIQDSMKGAMITAIEDALRDGAITEEQAEAWLERLEQVEAISPGMPFGGRGRAGTFRNGFSTGMKFSRQMMLNHEYLDAAIADLLDISVEELDEIKTTQGFNLKTYAYEQGLSEAEIATLRMELLTNAVSMALDDGAITQEQADLILERLENFEGRGIWFNQP